MISENLWAENDSVIDIGCGVGKWAERVLETPLATYIGIDCVESSIRMRSSECTDSRARFVWADLRCGYNPNGTIDPKMWKFPVADETQSVVLFCSVFTHIPDADVIRHYLREAWRVLIDGGTVFVSWFRSPPNELSLSWERAVHREADIISWIHPFKCMATENGLSTKYHDQWLMRLSK